MIYPTAISATNFNGQLRLLQAERCDASGVKQTVQNLLVDASDISGISRWTLSALDYLREVGLKPTEELLSSVANKISNITSPFSVIKLRNNETYIVKVTYKKLEQAIKQIKDSNVTYVV